jgi:RNA recognition motif-containing protein
MQSKVTPKSREDDDDADVSFTIVVNNIPPGTNEDELEVACQKHGVVTKVRLDPKKSDIAWVEFEDKKGARAAARKGVRIGRTVCKAVRVMPKAFKSATDGGGGGGGGGKAASTTALVRGLPAGATADEVRALFADCGAIRDVRIACPASGRVAFVDFETKTSLHKARRLRPTLSGAALSIKAARHVAPPSTGGGGGEDAAANRQRPAFCRTIIVKNLPYQLGDTEERLKQRLKRVFQVCGSVAAVRPFMDRPADDGPPTFKGVAFVQFRETEAVDAALRMDGRDNDGRPMKIDWTDGLDAALNKKKAERRAAGGGRGGGGGGRGGGRGGGGGGGRGGGRGGGGGR